MLYAEAAVERAMKIQEVIVRALSGAITWLQAADILGLDPRSLRRWRARYQAGRPSSPSMTGGRQRPSRRQAPALGGPAHPASLPRALRRLERPPLLPLRLPRPRRDPLLHLRQAALQEAGLSARPPPGAAIAAAGSPAPASANCCTSMAAPTPGCASSPTSATPSSPFLDDATPRLLHAQRWPAETHCGRLHGPACRLHRLGLPIALYTDRAGWAFHTPKAGGPVDRTHLTQVGRALAHLGIEYIGAYSRKPAAGRAPQPHRPGPPGQRAALAGITTLAAANAISPSGSSPTTTTSSRGRGEPRHGVASRPPLITVSGTRPARPARSRPRCAGSTARFP